MSPAKSVILHVEDDPNDVLFVGRAFAKAGFSEVLRPAMDVDQAVAYMAGTGPTEGRETHPIPRLVLLDLKLPGKSGFDFLRWLRDQPRFRHLAVFVLTSSHHEEDVRRAYELGATAFLIKPVDFAGLLAMAQAVGSLWLGLVRYPEGAGVRPVTT